jgi:hypothetical protein
MLVHPRVQLNAWEKSPRKERLYNPASNKRAGELNDAFPHRAGGFAAGAMVTF